MTKHHERKKVKKKSVLPAVIPGTAIAQSACTLSVQQVPCHHREGGGGEGGSEVRGQI